MSDTPNPVAAPSQPPVVRIAVLMTCHNRRDRTLACLESLERQQDVPEAAVRIVLVDDGCTDGTGASVAARFPGARIVRGDGSLYWCGGMRVAFRVAVADTGSEDSGGGTADADYHLWLNDDVVLEPHALRTLLDTAQELRREGEAGGTPAPQAGVPPAACGAGVPPAACGAGAPPAACGAGVSPALFAHTRATAALVTGSCRDPRTGVHTYGGVRRRSSWPPLRFRLVSPAANRPVRCETVHGNVLLVPREAYRALGNLDEGFAHMVGDFDYGLRAGQLGIPCWIAPGFLAQCARHPVRGSMHDASLPLKQRLALARRPTGRTAWRQWMRFTRRHTGWRWPLFWAETLVSRVLLLWLWLLIVGKRPESDQ